MVRPAARLAPIRKWASAPVWLPAGAPAPPGAPTASRALPATRGHHAHHSPRAPPAGSACTAGACKVPLLRRHLYDTHPNTPGHGQAPPLPRRPGSRLRSRSLKPINRRSSRELPAGQVGGPFPPGPNFQPAGAFRIEPARLPGGEAADRPPDGMQQGTGATGSSSMDPCPVPPGPGRSIPSR